MNYPGWMIAKWQKERARNATPWKQMKDRNMTGVDVVFLRDDCQGTSYYLKRIIDASDKITYDYIANLGGRKKRASSEWTHHGGGGWVKFVTLDEKEFVRMQGEVQRLGGKVTVFNSIEDYRKWQRENK